MFMKSFVCLLTVTFLMFSSVDAQDRVRAKGSAQTESQAQAQKSDQSLMLDSGTQLSAELLTTLDAKKAKPGDEFKMRTLKPVVIGGKQAVATGSVLVGHVVEATQAEGKNGVSQLKLGFDQLQNKKLTAPFSATIQQITQATINSQAQADNMGAIDMSGGAGSRTSASGSSGGGGLLGGVTGTVGNTVGGVTGATTSTVNNTVGGVTATSQQTLGSVIAVSSETLNATAATAKGMISITSATTTEAGGEVNGNSMLSMTGRNVKVEKGAVFLLRTDKSLNLTANK
jgi:hypothetical protein